MVKQAVILCGGKGKRLLPFTENLPKPMVDINGVPFLELLIKQLSHQGINQIVLLTGYLSEKIIAYFRVKPKLNCEIIFCDGPEEWDTGKRLWEARNYIDEDFLLMYGDNFTKFDLVKMKKLKQVHNAHAVMSVVKKNPGNMSVTKNGNVLEYSTVKKKNFHHVEIGYMLLEKKRLFSLFEKVDCNLSDVLKRLIEKNNVIYDECGSYHSISDPKRYDLTMQYFAYPTVIFMDRDGVINEKAKKWDYITKWSEVKFIDTSIAQMQKLGRHGFKFIVISNQACIDRGIASQSEVDNLNSTIQRHLAKQKIDIIDFFVCPHGWNSNCNCRKPKPGSLIDASQKYGLQLESVFFIGDSYSDMQAADNAGAMSIQFGLDDEYDFAEQIINYYDRKRKNTLK